MEIRFERRHITPKTDFLLAAVAYRDCGVIGQKLMELVHEEGHSLLHYENRLRQANTDIYLIAAPKDRAQGGAVPWDFRKQREVPYWLWISVNGIDEANETMREFGIASYDENLKRLSDTGFLVIAKGAKGT